MEQPLRIMDLREGLNMFGIIHLFFVTSIKTSLQEKFRKSLHVVDAVINVQSHGTVDRRVHSLDSRFQ
jgi:hypothetical protein